MALNAKEIEGVSKLPPFKRYQHFLKRVADSEILYGLFDEHGKWVWSEVDGTELIPLWPAKEYAEMNKIDGWEGSTVSLLHLEEFMQQILPQVEATGRLFNIFSMYEKTGFVVSPDELHRDLSDELLNY